jgi:hypothetical protein
VLGVRPEMIPDSLETAAELKETISRRQFAPSDEGRGNDAGADRDAGKEFTAVA